MRIVSAVWRRGATCHEAAKGPPDGAGHHPDKALCNDEDDDSTKQPSVRIDCPACGANHDVDILCPGHEEPRGYKRRYN